MRVHVLPRLGLDAHLTFQLPSRSDDVTEVRQGPSMPHCRRRGAL